MRQNSFRSVLGHVIALIVCVLVLTAFIKSSSALSGYLRESTVSYKIRKNTSPSILDPVNFLCHTYEPIQVRLFEGNRTSKNSCYGATGDPEEPFILYKYGIEAPRVNSLCLKNPFHGFYDCIWPIVHYLCTCRNADNLREKHVIYARAGLAQKRKSAWVVHAQEMFLEHVVSKHLQVDKDKVLGGNAVCFRKLVKFRDLHLWRPLKYNMQFFIKNTEVTLPHPELLKKRGLNTFRTAILSQLKLSSAPIVPSESSFKILVYDRKTTKRRRWKNAADFVKRLTGKVLGFGQVIHVSSIPEVFAEQVKLFNDASLVVAPHGAAMANTLFMRPNSAVIEIASRRCSRAENSSIIFNDLKQKADPNSWTIWHTSYLDIMHLSAPCFLRTLSDDTADFETDNASLVQLTASIVHAQLVTA